MKTEFFSPQKAERLPEKEQGLPLAGPLILSMKSHQMDLQKKGFDIDRQTVNNWALSTSQDSIWFPWQTIMLKDFQETAHCTYG
ncbi:hypothetical protein [Faecalibaculum rodentium]|uniref:hypothetical protein n=1 Tax=Faecalibaculum rodentium TaxID=1702221 RepID=UPI003F668F2D